MDTLRVNGERLWKTIMETATFGATAAGGISRLTLSDEDKQVRDWFVRACAELGCDVWVDEVGSIFARLPGQDDSQDPIAMGSHLDTQPSGGEFDGIAGVLSGLEVLRTLHESGYRTRRPLELIDWTNEEGSRFVPTMIASGAFAGMYTTDFAYASRDREGKTFKEELERIGYRGERRAGDHRLAAYFEIHIEQGPVLYEEGTTVGVVTGAQGQMWYDAVVTGRQGHAGTTPMPLRRDPMLACARLTDGATGIALKHAPAGLSTVGLVEVEPNSRNVIPGSVFFTIDLRHPEERQLRQMHQELVDLVEQVKAGTNTDIELKRVMDLPPLQFDAHCVETVRNVAGQLGYSHRDIVSGPGHDAVNIARAVPTGMIFVPCEDGISHNEAESATKDDIIAGANVLLHAVLECDSLIANR
ncbi:MAG: Zn-dependent hydrolase [Chloroflexota bacterium]